MTKYKKKKIMQVKNKKAKAFLCPECLSDKVYYKSHGKCLFHCKGCNILIESKELIPLPPELFIMRNALIWEGEWDNALDSFRNKIKEMGGLKWNNKTEH